MFIRSFEDCAIALVDCGKEEIVDHATGAEFHVEIKYMNTANSNVETADYQIQRGESSTWVLIICIIDQDVGLAVVEEFFFKVPELL